MARSAATKPRNPSGERTGRDDWSRTVALVLIAVVLVLAASSWMAWLVVPLIFAVVLSIAMLPLADRLERLGAGRVVSSIACVLLVVAGLLVPALIITAQAGGVVRNSDRYIERLSVLAAESSAPIRDSGLVKAIVEVSDEDEGEPDAGSSEADVDRDGDEELSATVAERVDSESDDSTGELVGQDPDSPGTGAGAEPAADSDLPGGDVSSTSYWQQRIVENAGMIGGWAARGVGGVLGLGGQAIVLIFLILYILNSRDVWSDRIDRATKALGMTLRRGDMEAMGTVIARWTWGIVALAIGYGVAIGLACAILGIPQWPLWGVLTAILVLVPFFGPLIAMIMLATVATVAAGGWGVPLAIVAIFVVLQLVEGYLIQPRLYGRTVHFDSLTVLLGVLLFGFLWGPLGFIAALPVLVLIRGFVEATPGTEAVAALLGDES